MIKINFKLNQYLFAGGITDNSGQVNNNIVLLDQCLVSWSVEHVTLDHGQILMVQNAKERLGTPAENVINGDLYVGFKNFCKKTKKKVQNCQ